jgi:hypothetical protein
MTPMLRTGANQIGEHPPHPRHPRSLALHFMENYMALAGYLQRK